MNKTTVSPEAMELLANPPVELPLKGHVNEWKADPSVKFCTIERQDGRDLHFDKDDVNYVVEAANAAPSLVARIRELEGQNELLIKALVRTLNNHHQVQISKHVWAQNEHGEFVVYRCDPDTTDNRALYLTTAEWLKLPRAMFRGWDGIRNGDHGSPEAAIRAALEAIACTE